jgi:hypothetical protein
MLSTKYFYTIGTIRVQGGDYQLGSDRLSVRLAAAGYMAKHLRKPDGFQASNGLDVFSVSGCISKNFADYIPYWKHNGYWLFDSPEIIRALASENSISLSGASLFYYETYGMEFDGQNWNHFKPESFPTNVVPPSDKTLEGFDVVTFFARSSPECSPLSCNGLSKKIPTNQHCLLNSFEEAYEKVSVGAFNDSEPGPYRIFAVYCVEWPHPVG